LASQKAIAIVLRIVEFSESSAIVTLFTREFGKLGGMAKGAKRPKGPFASALDLLAVCRIVFLPKPAGGLDLLTEARLERRFRPPAGDLTALYAAYYVAELLTELTDENDPHPELFDEADQTLVRLSRGDAVIPAVSRFEWATLGFMGYLPNLEFCAHCGQAIAQQKRFAFGLLEGGILCDRCRSGKREVVMVSSPAVQSMRVLARAGAGQSPWPVWPLAHEGEVRAVVSRYLTHLVGHRLRMHQYLGT
jgi:DNA repair protein RecO (recombination protein O)